MELYRVGQLRRGGKRSRIRNFELRRFNVDDTPRAETRASTNWPGNTKFVRELYAYVTRRLSFHRLPLPVSTRDNIIPRVTAPQASRQREERISYYERGLEHHPLSPLFLDYRWCGARVTGKLRYLYPARSTTSASA